MLGIRFTGRTLPLFACFSLAGSALAGLFPRQDRSWSNYYNPKANYCVDYPSRWITGDAFEDFGFYLKPDDKYLTEIDVTALPDHNSATTLIEEFQAHIDSLRKFELAGNIQILARREILLFGSPALSTKYSYFDPQNSATMLDEVVFAIHAGILYRLELATRAGDQRKRFEVVFQRLITSFRFDCPPHPLPRGFASSRQAKGTPIPITRPPISTPHSAGN